MSWANDVTDRRTTARCWGTGRPCWRCARQELLEQCKIVLLHSRKNTRTRQTRNPNVETHIVMCIIIYIFIYTIYVRTQCCVCVVRRVHFTVVQVQYVANVETRRSRLTARHFYTVQKSKTLQKKMLVCIILKTWTIISSILAVARAIQTIISYPHMLTIAM